MRGEDYHEGTKTRRNLEAIQHFLVIRIVYQYRTETMKVSLREALVNSHVAAIAIAVLLASALRELFEALLPLGTRIFGFLFTAAAIQEIPYFSPGVTAEDRLVLITVGWNLYMAAIGFSAAWIISKWAYRSGPIEILRSYGRRISWRNNA